jgi:hypothetical protein
MQPEIHQLLVTSTAHVTADEAKVLTAQCNRNKYGWFFYIGSGEDEVFLPIVQPSPGLDGVIHHARTHGCVYVLLDRDADKLPNVPSYEW